MSRNAATPTAFKVPCERCHKQEAKHIVDVHAVVRMTAKLCERCMGTALRKYPASNAVRLHPEYTND